jgi:Fe-Mn family superoxide dismutase
MNKLALYCSAYMNFPYTRPPLDYAYSALEPYVDEQTMHLHHDKHHQAYIDSANKVVADHPQLQKINLVELLAHLDELPADIRMPLQNNGGGHLNHTLFWDYMTPQGAGEPQGKLSQAMIKHFGGFTQFKEEFDSAAKDRSGSGWAWLSVTPTGDLETGSTANQDTPLSNGHLPILGLDVWEHAYYLKYHNKRPEYITNWCHVVNWKKVQEQFAAITG